MLESVPGGAELMVIGIMLVAVAIPVAGIWKTFKKAGEPKYAALVPLYNVFIMTRIGGISPLWTLLWLVPIVNIVAAIRTTVAVADAFDAGALLGVGIGLVPWLGWPILGFSGYQYQAS